MDGDYVFKTFDFGTDGPIVLTGSGSLATGQLPSPNYLKLADGTDVTFTGGLSVTIPNTISMCARSQSATSFAASLTVSDGAMFTVAATQSIFLSHESVFCVDDATATITSGIYLNYGHYSGNNTSFGSQGGIIRLAGTAPCLTIGTNLRGLNQVDSKTGGAVEFLVPAGGYAEPPLVMTGTGRGETFCGDVNVATGSAAVLVRVPRAAPACHTFGRIDTELATWRVRHTDGAALVSLEAAPGDDPANRLYLTDDDLSLRFTFRAEGTLIFLR